MMRRIIGTSAFENGLFKEDRFFISLVLIYGMGILSGSVAVAKSSVYLEKIWQGYIIRQCSIGLVSLILETFFSFFIFLAANYIIGHCAIGKPFLCVIVFVFSIGKGIIFSSFYINYSLFVLLKTCVLLGVSSALMSALVIMSAKTSAEHSKRIFDYGYRGKNNVVNLKKYNRVYLVYLFFSVLICTFDAIMMSKIEFIIG